MRQYRADKRPYPGFGYYFRRRQPYDEKHRGKRADRAPERSHGQKLLRRMVFCKSQRPRSEEHTSELQSLMSISYTVFCLKNKTSEHMSIVLLISSFRNTVQHVYYSSIKSVEASRLH